MMPGLHNDYVEGNDDARLEMLIDGLMASVNRKNVATTERYAAFYSASNKRLASHRETALVRSSHALEDNVVMAFVEGINPPLNPFGEAHRD